MNVHTMRYYEIVLAVSNEHEKQEMSLRRLKIFCRSPLMSIVFKKYVVSVRFFSISALHFFFSSFFCAKSSLSQSRGRNREGL